MKEKWDEQDFFRRNVLLNRAGIPKDKRVISKFAKPYATYKGKLAPSAFYEDLSFKQLQIHVPNVAKQLKKLGINPHIHTTKQLNKMTKKGLIRLVVKLEKFILSAVYQMYKSKLSRLRKTNPRRITLKEAIEFKQKGFETAHQYNVLNPYIPKRKKKRKFSRKQLAAQRLFAKRARAGTLRKRRRR